MKVTFGPNERWRIRLRRIAKVAIRERWPSWTELNYGTVSLAGQQNDAVELRFR
jgi:hypothetical protein